MTEVPSAASRVLTRRVGWFVLGCAAAGLALTIVARITGGTVRWTSWALPILVAANGGALSFDMLKGRPWLTRVFLVLSLGLAAAIFVSETLTLLHR